MDALLELCEHGLSTRLEELFLDAELLQATDAYAEVGRVCTRVRLV